MDKTIRYVSVILLLVLSGGCGRNLPDGMPALQPTIIRLTQEGQPVQNVRINIYPEDGELQRWGASGKTDASGKADLYTQGRYAGAVIGRFRIVVQKAELEPSKFTGEVTDLRRAEFERMESARKAYHLIDPVYAGIETTPLSFEVTKGRNDLSFDLGKSVRILVKPVFSR